MANFCGIPRLAVPAALYSAGRGYWREQSGNANTKGKISVGLRYLQINKRRQAYAIRRRLSGVAVTEVSDSDATVCCSAGKERGCEKT